MKAIPVAILLLVFFAGCGCLRKAQFVDRTTVRDTTIVIRGDTVRDTLRTEVVRWDTLTRTLTLRVRDTVLRTTSASGIEASVTLSPTSGTISVEAIKKDTAVVLRTTDTLRNVLVAPDTPPWWPKVVWFIAGLFVAIVIDFIFRRR